MSNKCEWKDGKFKGCCAMQARLSYKYEIKKTINMDITTVISNGDIFIFCPFCGADIRKPEEKPLIVKSGGTWVAHFEGVDYLFHGGCSKPSFNSKTSGKGSSEWVDFNKITLDDEIAKLRPIIIKPGNSSSLDVLYGVDHETAIYLYGNGSIDHLRLATPQELQETKC